MQPSKDANITITFSKSNWEAIANIIQAYCPTLGPDWQKWGNNISAQILSSVRRAMQSSQLQQRNSFLFDDDIYFEPDDPSEWIHGYRRDDPDLYIEYGPHPEDW